MKKLNIFKDKRNADYFRSFKIEKIEKKKKKQAIEAVYSVITARAKRGENVARFSPFISVYNIEVYDFLKKEKEYFIERGFKVEEKNDKFGFSQITIKW